MAAYVSTSLAGRCFASRTPRNIIFLYLILMPEGLDNLIKIIHLIAYRTSDLPFCRIIIIIIINVEYE
jgi:hypothetical protein